MKKSSLVSAILALVLMVPGCTTVKRFQSATFDGEDPSLVDIRIFGTRLTPSTETKSTRTLWDLSASAQTQMIQILDRRYPDNAQFSTAMNQQYLMPDQGPVMDFTPKDLRMVFTISRAKDYAQINEGRGRFSPADRIEWLSFTLEVPEESGLNFTGWNRYETEYGEIGIADMSFDRTLDLDVGVDTEYGSGKLKRSAGRREDQQLKSRFLKLNGSISDRKIRIEEEGTREIDLTGNVTADVSLRFEGFPEKVAIPLFSDGEEQHKISSLLFEDVLVPRMEHVPDVIFATLTLEFIYRHVESGWKTFQEWDDRVIYYEGKISREVPLFDKDEIAPRFFCIRTETDEGELVRARSLSGEEISLKFRNYGEATGFLEWLSIHTGQAGEGVSSPIKAGKFTFWCGNRQLFCGQGSLDFRVTPYF